MTLGYFRSCLELKESLDSVGVKHSWLTTDKESLITRARNMQSATFLESDFERMMFIDADIEFNAEDVAKLWNMDCDVAVGAYSMKRPDAVLSAWKDGKLVEITDQTEPFEVDFAGTGFMMIKREVFEKMKPEVPKFENQKTAWAFFQTPVEDETFLSEDYFFCKKFREMGGKIMCDPTIKLGHWGTYRYG